MDNIYTIFNFHEIFLLEQFRDWFEFFKEDSKGSILLLTKDSYQINRISALLSMYTRFYPGARIQIREDVMIVAWNKEFKKKEIEGFHPYPEMSVFSFLDKIKSRSMVYRYELMEHFIQEDRAKAKNSLDLSQWKSILKSSLHFYEMGYFSLALDLSNQLLEIDSLNEEYRYFNLLLKHQQQTHHYEKFYKQWLEEDEPSLPQDTTESILRKPKYK